MWVLLLVKLVIILLSALNWHVAASDNVVCYYINSNGYSLIPPEDLDASLCTHINYAFIQVVENGNLSVQNAKLDIDLKLYKRVTTLKFSTPGLKVLLSVGDVTATLFSSIAADSNKRQNFVTSAKYFLQKYSFDGLDIDWEKPGAEDEVPFVQLLSELRAEFDKYGWILSVAVYPNPSAGYDVVGMSKYIDMFNVMCYNYYGPWSAYTGQNSPLFAAAIESTYEKNNLNLAVSVRNWLNAGAPKEKLNIGLAFYGRSFTLVNPDDHDLHAPITGVGKVGSPTFGQICTGYGNWTRVWDDEQKNPFKFLGDQWLGYDDERSIKEKVKYITSHKLGGSMIWHIGGDDIKGECGPKQGLLRIINNEIKTGGTAIH